jgi:hypothetical protein
MVRLRRGLNIADSVAIGVLGKRSSGYQILEQLAYATLVAGCERVLDEVGVPKSRCCGHHG